MNETSKEDRHGDVSDTQINAIPIDSTDESSLADISYKGEKIKKNTEHIPSTDPLDYIENGNANHKQSGASPQMSRYHASLNQFGERDGERTYGNHAENELGQTDKVSQFDSRQERQQMSAYRRRLEIRKRENKMVSRIVGFLAIALVIILAISAFSFYRYFNEGLEPLNSKDSKLTQVEVPIGTSTKGIGTILEKNNIIKSGFIFAYYVKKNNLTEFQGGYYQMSPNMTLSQIATMLQEGGTAEPEALADAKLTVVEGYTIENIGDMLEKNTDFSKKDFISLMENEEFFNQMVEKYPELLTSAQQAEGVRYRLEGYLFPATFNYYKDSKLEDIVEQMISKTNDVMSTRYEDISAKDMTVQEVMTLASLVEKEGVSTDDRRKIAQVFFNRIDDDMPLQSDISILYALNETKEIVTEKDTQVESPYNLYVNHGYGPGPMCSPGEDAIDAVINPDPNTYLYFLADVKTGEVYFANTYEEHLLLKEKYVDSIK